jgi:hypothetical protein
MAQNRLASNARRLGLVAFFVGGMGACEGLVIGSLVGLVPPGRLVATPGGVGGVLGDFDCLFSVCFESFGGEEAFPFD